MESKVYKFSNKQISELKYMLHLPAGYTKEKSYPLLVALHGAGERGEDVEKVCVHGVMKYIKAGKNVPAVVIAPLCPSELVWNHLTAELFELINYVAGEYAVDTEAISLTGLSMGGFGTWEMGICYPGFFAALAPVCGGGMSWRVKNIGKTPVRAFHGDLDDVVPPFNSYDMVDKLNKSGGNATLTVFNGVGHNSWEPAYESTDVIDWLISQRR